MDPSRRARTEEFEALRPRLFGIAYRMTGSVGDAEDACQDALAALAAGRPATVDNAEAYLVRVVTRLALDRLQSAQRRRETYVGPYLPGAAGGRRRRDAAGGGGRARRLAHAGVPRAARRAHAEGARGAAAPRRVRLPVRRDRDDGRPVTRRVPAAGEPHAAQARPRARVAAASRRGARARARRQPARDRRAAATSKRSWRCSRPTWCCSPTAARSATRRVVPSSVPTASRAWW